MPASVACAWGEVVAKAVAHKAEHPGFKIDDYLEYVRLRGEDYIRWASVRRTSKINKYRKSYFWRNPIEHAEAPDPGE